MKRLEGVEARTLKVIGTSEEMIYNEFTKLLDDKGAYAKMAKAVNPYGDGNAAVPIGGHILEGKPYQQRENEPESKDP